MNKKTEVFETQCIRKTYLNRSAVHKHRCAVLCSKCHNIIGEIEYDAELKVSITHDEGISSNFLYDITPSPSMNYYDLFEVCRHCNDMEHVYVVDNGLKSIISILNKSGYRTLNSCEGHFQGGDAMTMPYIQFKDNPDKLFDFNDELLKYWYCAEEHVSALNSTMYCLRLKEDCPVDVMFHQDYLEDLAQYLYNKLGYGDDKQV